MDQRTRDAETTRVDGCLRRLLIVDDDPVAAGMLALMLRKHGNDVLEVTSGEACLNVMESFLPQVVLLDIDMPGGIDGFRTCELVRSRFDRDNLSILFLSSHDTLEDRLHAYDVGGDDFVPKPFEGEELRRKVAIAIEARSLRSKLADQKLNAEQSANVLMQGYDEMSSVLRFIRGALGCRSMTALAELIIESLRAAKVDCHIQLRGSAAGGTLTMTPNGPASPLELSVIEHMQSHGRLFQFKSRMIVNYDSVSVLVINMPGDDELLAGRIRDYVAIVAEAAEDAVAHISLRADAVERARELRSLAEACHAGLIDLHATQRTNQSDTRFELERMVDKIEAMYYRFGLTDSQEAEISGSIRSSKGEVLKLFDCYEEVFETQFGDILSGLNRAATYQVDVEEVSVQTTEVWL